MRDGLQGRSYLEELDCFGTVLLVKVGGGGGGGERVNFCLTIFGRVSEILAVITLPDRNGITKLFHQKNNPCLWTCNIV